MPPCHGEVARAVVDLNPTLPPRPSWQLAFHPNVDARPAWADLSEAVELTDNLLRPGFDCASFWISALIQIDADVTCAELKTNTVSPASFESCNRLIISP